MTAPTPRSAAPGRVRRIEEVTEAMQALGDLEAMPVPEALARVEEIHQRLLTALNPEVTQPSLPRLGTSR
ncbi:hypothetical protein EII34_07970 [Arachnia propionica]|uniref:Uncharacterized protein n=1 Tax=Arachnia propionica TaxID=1750 RepID=A0A3P1T5S7_9ACTN|nr:hypothetical protein [Arachnia propionica]MDO5083415.1 hypothetical protein [Arachnia propionica]RRD04857.1 hypothetical protein EII34_07970 [Arachnia propionica]